MGMKSLVGFALSWEHLYSNDTHWVNWKVGFLVECGRWLNAHNFHFEGELPPWHPSHLLRCQVLNHSLNFLTGYKCFYTGKMFPLLPSRTIQTAAGKAREETKTYTQRAFQMHKGKKKPFLPSLLPTSGLAAAQHYFTTKPSDEDNCSNQLSAWISLRSRPLRLPRWQQCHQQSRGYRTHGKANTKPTRTLFGVQTKHVFCVGSCKSDNIVQTMQTACTSRIVRWSKS